MADIASFTASRALTAQSRCLSFARVATEGSKSAVPVIFSIAFISVSIPSPFLADMLTTLVICEFKY